ncbi:polysaccharide biosynthesis tyrosine autokinase [Niastella caeni]|uniref:Polysaccharide biosynthesis tyrosine autokinase n=1 Tax=Niastella caeni TaxID=2569763 RepID=A0A4V4H170_9BACT|nr:polysaccharide biosynthesis tyrosine autokinase [Niastella caeni]THU39366.1 polysaccharide biosynthesis tyrosine autokinase [Niastella caeni]
MQTNKKTGNEMNIVSVAINWYLPYWPLFLILIVLGLAGAWAYLKYFSTPVYETYATIMVKDEKKGVDESGVLEALQIYPTKNIVENEMEVIHSRKLMEKVVEQLQLYAPVYEAPDYKQGKIHATSAYTSSPITITARKPDDLKETGEVDVQFTVNYFSDNNGGEFRDVIKKVREIVIGEKIYPIKKWVSTPWGELKFEHNDRQLSMAEGPLFFRLYKPKNIAPGFISNLGVKSASKLSTTINLTFRDEVPERGEDILNKLLVAYNRLSIEEKKGTAANTLEFIETRLGRVEKELDSIEHIIQSFRTDKGVVNLGEQSRQYLENVGSNDRKIADLSMQLAALGEMERYVNSNENNGNIVPATLGISDPVLSELMQKMYNAKVEYEKLMKSTGENNPFAIAVAKEIEQLRPLIAEKLRSHRINLEAGKKDLTSISGGYNSMLRTIPQKERELMDISREQVIKNSIYNYLLEKREQTALASSSANSDSKIVDMAKSSVDPVSPKKSLIYFAVLACSIGLAIGVVSAKEMLNKKILFRSEIESLTVTPVIAEISANKEEESLLKTGSKVSVVAEQFRHLRAAIGLIGRQKDIKIKRILVTSSISSEGKTYISTNLARSLALAGNKVVLVDLDIRKPKTSSILGVIDNAGVAEFLEGSKMPEEIVSESMDENLYIIGAGGGKDNSRELILSGKLGSLLSYLNAKFDYIILDASPIDPVSDSYIFSDYCDVTLFVMRHGRTPKAMVQILDNNNKFRALKNPHIVFNGIRSRGIMQGMYGYSYGYGYENVYREKQRRKSKLQRV